MTSGTLKNRFTFNKTLASIGGVAFYTLIFLTTTREAATFELVGMECQRKNATFFVKPNFPATAGSKAEQIEALRCAAEAWRTQSAADFKFHYGGEVPGQPQAQLNNRNDVFYSPEEDNDALAVTLISGVGNRYHEFDTIFFGSTAGQPNNWQYPGEPEGHTTDLYGTAVHEFGHALGLDHSSVRAATMFFAIRNDGLTLRTLHRDDIDGVESIYGTRPGFSSDPRITAVSSPTASIFGGESLTLAGVNFTWPSDTTITINGTSIPTSELIELSCTETLINSLPTNDPGPADIVLSNQIGTTTLENAFEYRVNPNLISIEPSRGPLQGGLPIQVHGGNLSSLGKVFIAGQPIINPRYASLALVEGTLPARGAPGTVNLQYVVGSENSSLLGAFTYFANSLRVVDTDLPTDSSPTLVDLQLSNSDEIDTVTVTLEFDKALLEVLDISTAGTIAHDTHVQNTLIDNVTGTVEIQIESQSGPPIPTGTDEVLLRFKVRARPDASAGAIAPVRFANDGLLSVQISGGDSEEALGLDGKLTLTHPPDFIRGETDGDHKLTIVDPLRLLFHLFVPGFPLLCPDAADANDTGTLDNTDALIILRYLFLGATTLEAPFPLPGPDPSEDTLSCVR